MLLTITITYCTACHYTPYAVSLAAELLEDLEPEIDHISLTPSEGGRFEVMVNGKLLYSKIATGRHANPGEVKSLVKKYNQEKH